MLVTRLHINKKDQKCLRALIPIKNVGKLSGLVSYQQKNDLSKTMICNRDLRNVTCRRNLYLKYWPFQSEQKSKNNFKFGRIFWVKKSMPYLDNKPSEDN